MPGPDPAPASALVRDAPALMHEAARQLSICNSCRYCEGYCAVFPALELRQSLRDGDITYLANLCHDCRNCYDACMFAPPHEFAVNIPKALAEVRVGTYERYSWPRLFSRLFRRSGWGTAAAVLGSLIVVCLAVLASAGPGRLASVHLGPGAFYAIVPYLALVVPALVVSAYGIGVVAAGAWEFARDTERAPARWGAWARAAGEALSLRWLAGGGVGCYYSKRRGPQARRILHSLVFWGFMLAFVSTTLAAIYQDARGLMPPFAIWSAPVLFGIAGGALLIAGTTGMMVLKPRGDPVPTAPAMTAMDYAFVILLDLVAITGMLTLVLRNTRWMGPTLTLHLGVLAGLYVTAPYSKFVHFVYRYLALVKHAAEESRG